jgi:hypothetical protein
LENGGKAIIISQEEFFFFLMILGFELKASHLQSRTVLLDPYLQSIFCLVILEMRSCELFSQADLELLFSAS